MEEKPTTPEILDESLVVSSPATQAGGARAIQHTLSQISTQTGWVAGAKLLAKVNQTKGFDCPGCAWPDPLHRAITEFCENGAKAVADEGTQLRASKEFFDKYSVSVLLEKSDRWLNSRGRLTEPMRYDNDTDRYVPVTWKDAFDQIADTLKSLPDPNRAIFYTSGRTSNEAAYAYQLLVRAFGTNNLPDCSNMCHESSGVGLTDAIGIGKGTVLLEDFDRADLIFVVGQNPGTNHPRMLSALQSAVRNGCHVVSVNPLREAGLTAFAHPQEPQGVLGIATPISQTHVPVRINGDVALFKGVMKYVVEQDGFDRDFIESRTEGFDAFVNDLHQTEWGDIVKHSGISKEEIEELGKLFIESRRVIVCWAMGITQHVNGVANVQTLVNLLLLGGHFGRPGAGACPVRGHSNVQGDRTVGIVERPKPEFIDQLEKRFGVDLPKAHGFDTVHAINAMYDGAADVFFGMGGNFLSASPDTEFTATALRNCSLTVHVSTKLNRSHLVHGKDALILPCLGRTETDNTGSGLQFVTVENSMGIVHRSQGDRPPASPDLLSEVDIVCSLGERISPSIPWTEMRENYDTIRAHIEATIPGFEKYNERVREERGFALPNGPREGRFTTSTGKARFRAHPIAVHELEPNQFLMSTIRSHDQFNTTVYTDNDRYRGIKNGRRVALMHPDDIKNIGCIQGDVVVLASNYGHRREAKNFRVVPYDVPKGSVFTYFPEANVLVPIDLYADGSHTPASKSVIISVEKGTS